LPACAWSPRHNLFNTGCSWFLFNFFALMLNQLANVEDDLGYNGANAPTLRGACPTPN
jgi:hypothetical protein